MPANKRIDQPTGAGSGTSGYARTGLWQSRALELHDTGTGMAVSRKWILLDAPDGSVATISNDTLSPAGFTPVVAGRYRMVLRYDGDSSDQAKNAYFVFDVTKDNAGVDIPNHFSLPAYNEVAADSEGISGQGTSGKGWKALRSAVLTAMVAIRAKFDVWSTSDTIVRAASGQTIKMTEGSYGSETHVLWVSDAANVSTVQGRGSGGTVFSANTGNATVKAASGGVVRLEAGATALAQVGKSNVISGYSDVVDSESTGIVVSGDIAILHGDTAAQVRGDDIDLMNEGGTESYIACGSAQNHVVACPSGYVVRLTELGSATEYMDFYSSSSVATLRLKGGSASTISSADAFIFSSSTYLMFQCSVGNERIYLAGSPYINYYYCGSVGDGNAPASHHHFKWNGTTGLRNRVFGWGRAQTTDATVTTAATSISFANGSAYVVTAYVIGNTNGTSCGGYEIRALVRTSGGTTTIVSQTTTVIGEDVAGWDAVFDATSNTIRARVTGAAATNIAWEVFWDYKACGSYA